MKFLGKILIILVLLVVVVIIARNQIVKMAVGAGVKAATGLGASVGRADVGLFETTLGLYDFEMNNASKYKDREFISLPEIFVDYNLSDIMKNDIHLETVRINIDQMTVIKNADGSMNFQDIKAPPASSGPQPKVRIDKFSLKLGKVVYKDYSRGPEPKVKEYVLNVDETFEHITGAQDLIPLITTKVFLAVQRILINSSISDLSGIGSSLKGELKDVLGGVSDLGKGIVSGENVNQVKTSVGAVKDQIKGLFK